MKRMLLLIVVLTLVLIGVAFVIGDNAYAQVAPMNSAAVVRPGLSAPNGIGIVKPGIVARPFVRPNVNPFFNEFAFNPFFNRFAFNPFFDEEALLFGQEPFIGGVGVGFAD